MPSPPAPRVSVILTVYNRREFLSEALKSVLAQSFGDFEILVVDDSGTAAFRELVTAFQSGTRVRYLPNEATLGVARSIVKAADQARGDLIAIINDDDIWEESLLEELTAPLATEPGCVAAFSDHSVIDKTGQTDAALSDSWSAGAGRSLLPGGILPDAARYIIDGSCLPIAICAVFRKNAVDWSLMVPEVSGAYDYWISCLLAASGGAIYYVPKRLARYRVHSGMETKRRSPEKAENTIYMFSAIRTNRWFPHLDAIIRKNLAKARYDAARNKLHFNLNAESRRFFWRSFLVDPRPSPLAGIVATLLPCPVRLWLSASLRSIWPSRDR